MMNDEMKKPEGQQTSDEDVPAGALQSFADTIQEKAGLAPVEEERASRVDADEHAEPLTTALHDHDTASIVWKMKDVLRRKPVVGVISGMAIGFALGRIRK